MDMDAQVSVRWEDSLNAADRCDEYLRDLEFEDLAVAVLGSRAA
jgi:hypothetical protein